MNGLSFEKIQLFVNWKQVAIINGSTCKFLFSLQHPVPCSPFHVVVCMQCLQIAKSTFSARTEEYLNAVALREPGSFNCNIFFKIHIANLNAFYSYVKHFVNMYIKFTKIFNRYDQKAGTCIHDYQADCSCPRNNTTNPSSTTSSPDPSA